MSARLLVTWIRRWTAAQWEEPILRHKFQGHEGAIWSFVFLHDNVHIVSGSEDGTIRKWNCDTGLAVGEPWKGGGGKIYALALSPDGKTIACGREDGSVQRWNTDGEMMEGIWTSHGKAVRSLSWSPSGSQLTSGSDDGTIVIRNTENGKVEMGPIKTEQKGVCALAYSHSGERIASGGDNYTICIWDPKTGELVVGPIKGLGLSVTSLQWSSDSTKLYSASDRFARVFDSTTGKLLHRFEHDRHKHLYSVALLPRQNVLACVGSLGVAQLWDTESNQPLGQPFDQQNYNCHYCVSFSRDGNSLAYGGSGKKLGLWTVKDMLLQLPAPSLLQQSDRRRAQQETRPNSPSSSCLNADATGGDGLFEEVHDLYSNFFQSSQKSLPLLSSGSRRTPLFSARRLLNFFSRCCPPEDESIPKERPKRGFFSRRACLNVSLEPAPKTPNRPVPEVKVGEGERGDNRGSGNDLLDNRKDKGKERDDGLAADAQSLPSDDPTPLTELDSADNRNIWTKLMRRQRMSPASVKTAPTIKRPEVVEVYAVRGFQRLVVMKGKQQAKLQKATYSLGPNTSGSSPAGQPSQALGAPLTGSNTGDPSHAVSVQTGPSSHLAVVNGAQYSQVTGGPPTHASPSHFVTNYCTSHDIDSRSSIEGTCNRFLDRICFPCGHYHEHA